MIRALAALGLGRGIGPLRGVALLACCLLLGGLPQAASALACSPYQGQATLNELRVGQSGKNSSKNRIEVYNSGGVDAAVWGSWKLVGYYRSATGTVQLATNHSLASYSANGPFISGYPKVLLVNRKNYAVDVALVDAGGNLIDYVALGGQVQSLPACLGTPAVATVSSSSNAVGDLARTTDGGAWPAAISNSASHTIGYSNTCTAGADLVVDISADTSTPIVMSTKVNYTVSVVNNSCSTSIGGIGITIDGITAGNFSGLSYTVGQGTKTQGASALSWAIGTLAARASATLVVSGNPKVLGDIVTTARVSAPTSGLVSTGNDSSVETITVSDFNYLQFALGSDTVTEGSDASYSATISVNQPPAKPITITYSVAGTAGAGDTNLPASGSVTINPNDATSPDATAINFSITNDGVAEPTKTITLTITGVTSQDSAVKPASTNQSMTLTLLDDDASVPAGPDHYELSLPSASLNCQPSVVTVTACATSASPCTSPYTGVGGGTATLSTVGATLGAGTVTFNANGVASTTLSHPTAANGTVVAVTLSGESSAAVNARKCCPDGASCRAAGSCSTTFSAAGLLLATTTHVAETAASLTVAAVKSADNSPACVPAFANVSRSVNLRCSYANPGTGSWPARVGGSALNGAGSASAACDTAGRDLALNFDAGGVATATLQYADVGQLGLAARYTGSAATADAGLSMAGSTSVIVVPHSLAVTGVTAGPIKAGSSFSATVSARNAAGAVTPNFAREAAPESVTLGWVRVQPTGAGTVGGSFSGSLGAFNGGSASAGDLAWTEVGRGDLLARLSSDSYLGSGLGAFGSSAAPGARHCADEGGTCTLPAGTTATVYYGNHSSYAVRTGVSTSVACSNGAFGDPLAGVVKKCWYVATTASNGSVGDFIPHHFDLASTAACGAFSYAGQPFGVTVTARNAVGATTLNFDGAAAITPNFAQAVTLSDSGAVALGTLSGAAIAATAFTAGMAQASPAFSFSSKATAPQTLLLRAANAGTGAAAISSAGHAEASMPLRSGRLRLSNAFGKAAAALQLPVVAEHWSGNAWVLNSADSCTTLPAASVALSNPRSSAGGSTSASTSASAITLASGSGLLTLAAPSPAGSGLSLDLAINLGSTAADQSCLASHPATTGAARPWLRAQNGACAASADRDPAARASFGIFSPETRKTVHVREIF